MNEGEQRSVEIEHNASAHRFEAEMDGRVCVVEYRLHDGEIAFTHTYVPPELRGRGIAEKLVRAGLEYARQERLRVIPECSYVASFIQRHREFAPLTT